MARLGGKEREELTDTATSWYVTVNRAKLCHEPGYIRAAFKSLLEESINAGRIN